MRDRAIGELIPQPLKTEVRVVLPDEALALMRDIHADRSAIAWCLIASIVFLGACTFRYVFGRPLR